MRIVKAGVIICYFLLYLSMGKRFGTAQATTTLDLTISNSESTDSTPTVSTTTSVSNPVCERSQPSGSPTIYMAYGVSSNAILIKYFPVSQNVVDYAVEYGIESKKYIYAQAGIAATPKNEYTIGYLKPNTRYYLRMRAGNGCATGSWSDEVSAKTKITSIPILDNFIDILTPDISSTPTEQELEIEENPIGNQAMAIVPTEQEIEPASDLTNYLSSWWMLTLSLPISYLGYQFVKRKKF